MFNRIVLFNLPSAILQMRKQIRKFTYEETNEEIYKYGNRAAQNQFIKGVIKGAQHTIGLCQVYCGSL